MAAAVLRKSALRCLARVPCLDAAHLSDRRGQVVLHPAARHQLPTRASDGAVRGSGSVNPKNRAPLQPVLLEGGCSVGVIQLRRPVRLKLARKAHRLEDARHDLATSRMGHVGHAAAEIAGRGRHRRGW